MYRFLVRANTQMGESLALVGNVSALGMWEPRRAVVLQTDGGRYPQWWADVDLSEVGDRESIAYKYLRLSPGGQVWEPLPGDRTVPIDPSLPPGTIAVDGGWWGVAQPEPVGYYLEPMPHPVLPLGPGGQRVVVLGSSVAWGCNAWLLRGWAWHLSQVLQEQFGHQVINVSVLGMNVAGAIARFAEVVVPLNPDQVVIALSLGNEGLAYCPPHQRRAVQRRFESGLLQLAAMVEAIGARPLLGGVYPHGHYTTEHQWLLWDTHQRMQRWGIPVLDWLSVLDGGQGTWAPGLAADEGHPNSRGHRLMLEAIDVSLFAPKPPAALPEAVTVFRDREGFQVFFNPRERSLRLVNDSPYAYTVTPTWEELQRALQQKAALMPGIYRSGKTSLVVNEQGGISSALAVPPHSQQLFHSLFALFAPSQGEVLFYDGNLGVVREGDHTLHLLNETEHEYNVHPMWREVRAALKGAIAGVYDDPLDSEAPFQTLLNGAQGLESRVRVAAHSILTLQYRCPLTDWHRVALVPLGDRCAARMLLYKLGYDGPAYPLDLTRSTLLSDVADMIAHDFIGMWDPALLRYSPGDRRLYHTKWTGLSFGHELEDDEDPLQMPSMEPVWRRMESRYRARAARFLYTLAHADEVLFIRTGGTTRGAVQDLLEKLHHKCHAKSFRLMLITPQDPAEFSGLPNVLHYNLEFNPDHMYADLGHWLHCTDIMGKMLADLHISSRNLFWCPPQAAQPRS